MTETERGEFKMKGKNFESFIVEIWKNTCDLLDSNFCESEKMLLCIFASIIEDNSVNIFNDTRHFQ